MMIPLIASVKCWSFLDVFRYSSYWFAFLYFIGLSTWFHSCYVPVAATLLGCARFILFLFRSYISWGCPLFVLPCCYDCRLYITRLLHVAALPCYVVFCGHLMFLPSCILLVAMWQCVVLPFFGFGLGWTSASRLGRSVSVAHHCSALCWAVSREAWLCLPRDLSSVAGVGLLIFRSCSVLTADVSLSAC